jgi:hypothetical protein
MYSYTVYTDPDTGIKARQSCTYGFVELTHVMLTDKYEVLTEDGMGDWKTSVYFNYIDERGNLHTVKYTVDSTGESSYEQLN